MWCLLGAGGTDCQFYGCRTEKFAVRESKVGILILSSKHKPGVCVWVIQEKQMRNICRLCFIKEQAHMYSLASVKPLAWHLPSLKKTNWACGHLPAYLLAFLGLPCRWPWIINSTYSVGHSCWSVAPICQTSWFMHSFWVSLLNFVARLEERVQGQDIGNLLCKTWKMVGCF